MSFRYTRESTDKARKLRKGQTDAEKLLWTKLRGRQLVDQKFYRQYPIGKYIVDFYCPEKKLIIELDGSQHLLKKEYDAARSEFLETHGLTVLRFWDNDVLNNIKGVLVSICWRLR